MKKLITFFLLSTIILAQNPIIYSALGDTIYNNIDNIQKLKDIPAYNNLNEKIDKYTLEVKKVKKFGFYLEKINDKQKSNIYLNDLRKLSKTNDFFLRSVEENFERSIKNQDNMLFFQMINSGLLKIDEHKVEIGKYYFSHENDINTTGVIETYFKKELEKKQKTITIKKSLTKEEIEAAKIKRIRKKDKQKQEAIKNTLEEELIKKKIKIIQDQKNQLNK